MNTLITTFELLGQHFYLPPDKQNQSMLEQAQQLTTLLNWPDAEMIKQQVDSLARSSSDELEYQFSVLFEGQGHMPCPPWGSVYLNEHNMVFGDSTLQYRAFLRANHLDIDPQHREPEDQFGLMLLVLARFLAEDRSTAAMLLLSDHLLPWAHRYLELLVNNSVSQHYAALASITQVLLESLQQEFRIEVKPALTYF